MGCLFCMDSIYTRGERERKRRRPEKEKLFVSAKKRFDFLLTDMLTLVH